MKKRIAVVTLWDSHDNYGQILQCYALQKHLLKEGCDAILLKTKSDTLASSSLKHKFLKLHEKIFSVRFWELLRFRYKLKRFSSKYSFINRHFDEFRESFIKCSDKIYDIDELNEHCPSADIFITGSDQVWSTPSELYFLNFVPEGKRKYSYAASFGCNSFSTENCMKMSMYLKTFDEVTVREYSAVEKCRQFGILSKRVIDPTGLLTRQDYTDLAEIPSESGYILLYLLGNYTDINIRNIFKYAKKNKIEVKYVASQGRNDKYPKIFPSPTEWLGLIANAKYVITNSYHCCMFSIYFQKKFIALKLTGIFKGMNTRIDTLFSQYKMPRLKTLHELETTDFNYKRIGSLVEQDRDKAMKIIEKWIK